MTPDQHARAKQLFFQARELDADSRADFLNRNCSDDDQVVDEVTSLLAHDDSTTIMMKQASTVADIPFSTHRPRAKTLGRYQRAAAKVLLRVFGRRSHRLLLFLLTVLVTIGLAIWTYVGMKAATQSLAGSDLQTILNADVAALQLWIEEKKKDVRLWSSRKDLRSAVAELVRISEANRDPREQLLQAPAMSDLNTLLEKYDRFVGRPERDGVVTRDGVMLASHREEFVGSRLNSRGVAGLTPVFQGQTLFIKPQPDGLFGLDTEPDLDSPVVYFVAPVRSEENEVIAAAVFGFPADGEFTSILAIARVGETGETYVFDASGELLSESRFDDELRASGLLPDDPSVRSIFRMDIRDPGPQLQGEQPAPVEMAAWPLTRLAADAIAAGRKGEASEQEGLILEPYRNYRGATVIGAWKWLPEYSIGVANEVEVAEKYSPMRYPVVAEWIRFGLLTGCLAALATATCWIAVLGRDVEEAWQLGQYTLEEQIGEGGMGVVYRARHALLKRPTAIKLLRPDVVDEDAMTRFQREVQIAGGLTHPNTIDIFDFGKDSEGNFYCVMEFLDGRTLESAVRSDGPFAVERVVKVLLQVAGSLHEAHQLGLVHRDIKPSNIMLCEQGGIRDFVKVLDFGLAREVRQTEDSSLTQYNLVAGTPAYLAPERLTDPASVDRRSDLYSLGAVGYYLLTGRRVRDGQDIYEVVGQILEQEPRPLSELTSGVLPGELESLIMQCLARDPDNRPASAEELIAKLRPLARAGSDV